MLMIVDEGDKLSVYLEKLVGMDGAIKKGRRKLLHKERVGQEFSVACDEQKRLLVICSSAKVGNCYFQTREADKMIFL